MNKNIVSIQKQTLYRITESIKTWRDGLAMAESYTNPNRVNLLRCYKDVIDNNHLLACVNILKERLKEKEFNIVKQSGSIDKNADNLFHKKWFYDILDKYIDTQLYGHSLIQIYDKELNMSLIDREYVCPEKHLIKDALYSNKGIDYTSPQIYKWLIEIGDRNNLGMLSPLCPTVIYIKNANSFWGEVQEVIGFPTIIAKSASQDRKEREQLGNWVKELGRRSTAVIGIEDEIEFKEAKSSDIYSVYLEMIKYLQSNISKVLLGGTEMIDGGSGGSEARAKVHEQQLNTKINSLIRSLTFFINDNLIPKLAGLGLVNTNNKIEFVNETDKNILADLHLKVSQLLTEGQIDPKFIEEIYNIKLYDSRGSVQPSSAGTIN